MPKSRSPRNNRNIPARNNNGNNSTASVSAEIQTRFSGPMPPPAILEGYEKIVPGAAERILKMAEASMKHQQQYDNALLEASRKQVAHAIGSGR